MTDLNPVQDLKARVESWAVKLRVRPSQVRVQRMTRKWGSCSTAGTITFATDLVYQAVEFQDFVIVHELLHLRLPNHSRVFKSLMSIHVPAWRVYESLR